MKNLDTLTPRDLLPKTWKKSALLGWAELHKFTQRIKNRDAEILQKNAARIREAYNYELDDRNVLKVVYAEEENAICESCQGLPCAKSRNQHFSKIPRFNEIFGTINVAVTPCKFIRAYWRKNKLAETFQAAGIPQRYEGLTFDDYKVDANNKYAVEVAHSLLKHTDKGAFFFGSYGTGKTMLASIIAQEHLKLGRDVLFIKLPDLFGNIRKTYSDESKNSDIDVLDKIYKVDILILDDLSGNWQSKFAGETLFKIIDARYNAQLQTIMTSNNRLKDIETARRDDECGLSYGKYTALIRLGKTYEELYRLTRGGT